MPTRSKKMLNAVLENSRVPTHQRPREICRFIRTFGYSIPTCEMITKYRRVDTHRISITCCFLLRSRVTDSPPVTQTDGSTEREKEKERERERETHSRGVALFPGPTHDVRFRPNTDKSRQIIAVARVDIRASSSIRPTIKMKIKYWKPRGCLPDFPYRPQISLGSSGCWYLSGFTMLHLFTWSHHVAVTSRGMLR